ncbi:Spy/CpxP family protein refolding chaperone [Phenylobacterium sp.]|jgi:hypothetical protein|uniref:Spy/CpxP family protein refolding chaperone n=1 Tax=Phenylobacterium sp. TaxID=1871053 RepID=UPI002F94DE0C
MIRPALAAAMAALLAGGAAAAYAQTQPAEEAIRQAQRDARKAERDSNTTAALARKAQRDADRGRDRVHRVMVRRLGDEGDRAEHLRNILQLRPNQEAALTAYVDAMKPKHDQLIRFDAADEKKSTPERLAEMETRIAEREAAGRARIDATRRFYAQLDERQKKAFDELPLMMGPGEFGPMPVRAMRIFHDGPGFPGADFHHGLMPPPPLPPASPAPPVPPTPPTPPSDL